MKKRIASANRGVLKKQTRSMLMLKTDLIRRIRLTYRPIMISLMLQAGFLAEKLQRGEPCPVCGSTIHPHPHQAEKSALTKEELNILSESVRELQEGQAAAAKKAGEAKAMLDAKEKNCIQIWEKLRQKVIAYSRDEMGELDSEKIQGLIETWKKALKDEEKQLQKDKKQLQQLKNG